MGKKIAIAILGTGTVAAVGAGATLMGGGSNTGGDIDSESNNPTITPLSQEQRQSQVPTPVSKSDWLSDSDNQSHKEKYFGDNMAFSGVTFNTANAPTARNGTFYQKGFKVTNYDSYAPGAGSDVKTNLIVTVERKQWGDSSKPASERKGSGTMTWFGSWVNTKTGKGFITFNQAKTDAIKKGLVLTGYFYLLKKNNGDDNGTVKYKKEVTEKDNKVLTFNNFEKYFPRPYYYTQVGRFDEVYYTNGDFINSSYELNGGTATICDEDSSSKQCSGEPTKVIKQEGEGEGYTDQWWEDNSNNKWNAKGFNKPNHWYGIYHQTRSGARTNAEDWYEFMYDSNNFPLQGHLGTFSYGTGKPKEGKGFRREGDNQQLRGTQKDGGAA